MVTNDKKQATSHFEENLVPLILHLILQMMKRVVFVMEVRPPFLLIGLQDLWVAVKPVGKTQILERLKTRFYTFQRTKHFSGDVL